MFKGELHGIDDEIETQKNMLQQADDTLNQILEKMAADVHKIDEGNEFEPGQILSQTVSECIFKNNKENLFFPLIAVLK